MAKKLSTEEILKAARAQATKGGAPQTPPEAPPAAPAQEAAVAPASEPKVAAPVAAAAPSASAPQPTSAPKSTKDILAAARAQAQAVGGLAQPAAAPSTGEKPAARPAAGAPSSTKDILAAARAQSGGAGAPAASAARSTKDILAAARAQSGSGGGAPAAGAAKPAGKPAAAKATAAGAATAVAAKPVGNRPSVQEMLKAAREGKPAGAATTELIKPAEATLIIPQKPALRPQSIVPVGEPRRGFLAKLGMGTGAVFYALFGTPFRTAWTSFAALSGLWGLETARFMMPNVLVEPPSKFKVGPPSDYPPDAVSTKWTAQYAVWIVRDVYKGKDIIYALQTVCTHLGCTPNWLEGERKFKCPCHGSGFYITGINFEGPAPRPLERMAIRMADDGLLEVDKSRKFQQELGQWEDPASYVEVT